MSSEQNQPPIVKVAPDAPNRCQAVGFRGQCEYGVSIGSKVCPIHGSALDARKTEKKNMYQLLEARWQVRVDSLKDHDQLKTLNSEIGILRLLVEERINAVKTPVDMVLASQGISDLIMKVNALVVNAARLDSQLNNTLTKAQVGAFNQQILQILGTHVSPDILELVASDLETAMEQL